MNTRIVGKVSLALLLPLVLFTLAVGARPLAHAQPLSTLTVTDCSTDSQLQGFVSNASPGDTITFACSGTIALSQTLRINTSLTLDGSGQQVTLGGRNQIQVLTITSGTVILTHLTISGGRNNNNNNSSTGNGGAMFILATSSTPPVVQITDCVITNNDALSGGGIATFGDVSQPRVTITRSIISNNIANDAGGILNAGGIMTISNSAIANNAGADG